MITKILFATDFASTSYKAFKYALNLKDKYEIELFCEIYEEFKGPFWFNTRPEYVNPENLIIYQIMQKLEIMSRLGIIVLYLIMLLLDGLAHFLQRST